MHSQLSTSEKKAFEVCDVNRCSDEQQTTAASTKAIDREEVNTLDSRALNHSLMRSLISNKIVVVFPVN